MNKYCEKKIKSTLKREPSVYALQCQTGKQDNDNDDNEESQTVLETIRRETNKIGAVIVQVQA